MYKNLNAERGREDLSATAHALRAMLVRAGGVRGARRGVAGGWIWRARVRGQDTSRGGGVRACARARVAVPARGAPVGGGQSARAEQLAEARGAHLVCCKGQCRTASARYLAPLAPLGA